MWQHEDNVNTILSKAILGTIRNNIDYIESCEVSDQFFQKIKIQLMALGLVNVQQLTTTMQTQALFWILTDKGKTHLLKTQSIKIESQQ